MKVQIRIIRCWVYLYRYIETRDPVRLMEIKSNEGRRGKERVVINKILKSRVTTRFLIFHILHYKINIPIIVLDEQIKT